MNQTRFQKWMNAVDDDLLEETQQPIKKKRSWLYSAGAIAACLAVAVTAIGFPDGSSYRIEVT